MGIHIPVLLDETLDALDVRPGGRYVDGTLGRAGHALAIVARGARVLGIDRDADALAEVKERMEREGVPEGALAPVKGNHGDLKRIAEENGWGGADGILLDLGVSSPQLDEGGRGFSFLRDGPLDMRMDRSQGLSAYDLVNGAEAGELERIFRELGEEPRAKRIAREIVKRRASARFETTADLAGFVERILCRSGAHHPATRVFQALRMAVNDETGELERALEGAFALLKKGGRLAVITFESITDRIVKRELAAHAGKYESLQQGGERWTGKRPRARLLGRKPVTAGEEEKNFNARARSAKLRAAEIMED